jgi:hypothetical protein
VDHDSRFLRFISARLIAYSVSASGTTPRANPSEEIEVKELAPTGKLRVGVVELSAFLEEAKASGSVRRALDRAGMKDEAVAPAGR